MGSILYQDFEKYLINMDSLTLKEKILDEIPMGKPLCLQKGPNGKIRGRTKEELAAMTLNSNHMRLERKRWKEKIRNEIGDGKIRPSEILAAIFAKDADDYLRKLAFPIKLRSFLQNIPGIGSKKAETLLIIAQISTAKGRYDRRISYLVKEPIRKRLIEALDAWYDQYAMEKRYKRKRDLSKHDKSSQAHHFKKKKVKEPKIIK